MEAKVGGVQTITLYADHWNCSTHENYDFSNMTEPK